MHLADFVNGYPFKPEQLGDSGLPVIRIRQLVDPSAQADFASVPEGAVFIDDGDLVFSWSGSLEVRVWNRGRALLNQHLYRVDPYPDVDRRWLRYVLEIAVHRLEPLMHGSAMTHVTRDMLKSVRTQLPSLEEQRYIGKFLDVETTRIEALIQKKRRLSALLRERNVAAALELVLGTTSSRERVDSGIECIGNIPRAWRVARNKTFMREVSDVSVSGDEELLTVSHLTGVTPRSEKDVNMFLAESLEGYKLVQPGDLVVNTMWAWMGALGISSHAGVVSPSYGVYRIDREQADPWFVGAVLRSPPYVAEITRMSTGVWTSRLRLYPEVLLSMKTPLPSRDEQQTIVSGLKRQEARSYEPIHKLDKSVQLLLERRLALISATITGPCPSTHGAT